MLSGFMDGRTVVSMIEVTTMFRSSLGRDTGNRKQEGLLTGNNRQRAKKLMKVLYPKKPTKN
jgi:hypothetical protein